MKPTDKLCRKDLEKIKKITVRETVKCGGGKTFIEIWEYIQTNDKKMKYVLIRKWKYKGRITREDKTEGFESVLKALADINASIAYQNDPLNEQEKRSVTCELV